jgi:two-component system LytT family sensor kinase
VSVPPASGLIVDLLGFLTGTALYVMLVFMVWHERAIEGAPFLSRRGRLPLLTGLCGVIWNVGALIAFGVRISGSGPELPIVLALAFGALGFLPAVVVHSLLEGRETAVGGALIRPATTTAYVLSTSAAVMHMIAASRGHVVPSRPALWLLTIGFTLLAGSLLFLTRQQESWRRGSWVVALSIFAVSAIHFSRHVGNETWWVELATHQASLPLALAILIQDYRFGFADLFLKNAIALLGLMGVSIALLSGVIAPLLRWQTGNETWDPRAVVAFILLWIGTALTFPLLRRMSTWLVDRAVFGRPNYDDALNALARELDSADSEETVIARLSESIRRGLGGADSRLVDDPLPARQGRLAMTAAELRAFSNGVGYAVILRLQTVEAPHRALAIEALPAGRRLLSDDLRWLEAIAGLALRRIEAFRVARERMERNVREEAMHRMATEAELRALRAQLNPHFLFNALTTIGYLITAAPARALDTLHRLTSVLRSVLRRSTVEFCTLADEIAFVNAYLEIERARFEDRLRVTIDVAEDARDVLVPTLLLQPLVENAIKHGIAPNKLGGDVRVVARVDGSSLRVAIQDSGIGFEAERALSGTGVGLRSVNDRLRAHYGLAASLTIQSRSGQGATVDLVLPADRSMARSTERVGSIASHRKTG